VGHHGDWGSVGGMWQLLRVHLLLKMKTYGSLKETKIVRKFIKVISLFYAPNHE
jgi:hypothetical protein